MQVRRSPHARFNTRERLCLSLLAGGSLALAALAPVAAHAAPAAYTLVDLGTLPGGSNPFSEGTAVNNVGQVAGYNVVDVTGGSNTRAFRSGPNGPKLTRLGNLPGATNNAATGINDRGQVAGYSYGAAGVYRAFLSAPNGTALKDLGVLPGKTDSYGTGVNAQGRVSGYSYSDGSAGIYHAFLSGANGGPLQDLGTLPHGSNSLAFGVNTSGQVTGYSDLGTTDANGTTLYHAFLSGPNGGTLADLGTLPGGLNSVAAAVNGNGQVTGYADTAAGYNHAFLYANGKVTDLGTLPQGSYSYGYGVNAAGQVVGVAEYKIPNRHAGKPHAFLYEHGTLKDLNTLIAPGSGFELLYAEAVSDTGYVTGVGVNKNNQSVAFLLRPAQPPVEDPEGGD